LRQAYDYWQDQPGSIPRRHRRRTRGRRARGPRHLEATTAVVQCGRLTPGSGNRRPSTSCPPGVPHPRAQAEDRAPGRAPWLRLGTRTRLRGSPHAVPPRDGRRRENVERWDDRIPSGRYATQETRGRPRPVTLLLRQRMKRNAREDVAAPAGIRPTQASLPLPTRHHDPHSPSKHAAHGNPDGSPVAAWRPKSCNVKARSTSSMLMPMRACVHPKRLR